MFKRLFIGFLFFTVMDVSALAFDEVVHRLTEVNKSLVGVANAYQKNSNNVSVAILLLNKFVKKSFFEIVKMSFDVKRQVLHSFFVDYVDGTDLNLDFAGYAILADSYQNNVEALGSAFFSSGHASGKFDNVATLVFILHELGKLPYSNIVRMDFKDKQIYASELLSNLIVGEVVPHVGAVSVSVGAGLSSIPLVSTEIIPSTGAGSGSGVALVPSANSILKKNLAGAVTTNAFSTNYLASYLDGTDSKLILDPFGVLIRSKVGLQQFPFVGKYFNDGALYGAPSDENYANSYVWADVPIVIENDYEKQKQFVPAGVRAMVDAVAGAEVSFYTEVMYWTGAATKGRVPFDGKGKQFNVGFHGFVSANHLDGTGWNFATQGHSSNLNIGVFSAKAGDPGFDLNSDKIFSGIDDGDMKIGTPAIKGVHPHNNAYSNDEVRFSVKDGRKVITFWTVGVDGKKVVVTYHILLDSGDNKFNGLPDIGNSLGNLEDVINRIETLGVNVPAGEDKAAWDFAIQKLKDMYGVR